MIPKTSDDLKQDFEYQAQPTKTFKLNIGNQTITGSADNLEAMKQAIYLILNVERYENLIYSWNYGVELQDLFGKDVNYVLPELKRRITEALLQDSRITSVEDFTFETMKGKVLVGFKVVTIYGEVETEKVVNV
jgi:hypothetical protein